MKAATWLAVICATTSLACSSEVVSDATPAPTGGSGGAGAAGGGGGGGVGGAGGDGGTAVNLSPEHWPAGELDAYSDKQNEFPDSQPVAEAVHGMVSGTSSALAVRSGLEALLQGGTAADAVITTSLAQVALIAGAYVSYGGIWFATCYDADSGEIHYVNAGYNVPLGETDPLSIPQQGSGIPSGRTALVPGYFAGLEALHEHAGQLPFASVFEPAIYFAEEGFEVNYLLAYYIQWREEVLSRLPETKAIFTKSDGTFYQEGDWFTQPVLAETLRQVAQQGATYIYDGPWATRFAAAVQADGGTITEQDLAQYDAIWSAPLRTTYRGYELVTPGHPSLGGVNLVEAFNVFEAAGYPDQGWYTTDAEALFWYAQIDRLMALSFLDPQSLDLVGGGLDLSPTSRATKATAAALWDKMVQGDLYFTTTPQPAPPPPSPMSASGGSTHSDSVVAVDQYGNVCALTHTINTIVWGETGIFVDGISIPDSASFQQQRMLTAGPGGRVPEETNPTIVLRDGQPVLASSSIGTVHQRTVGALYHWLSQDSDIEPAFQAPFMLFPDIPSFEGSAWIEQVTQGHFSASLLQGVLALGLNLVELAPQAAQSDRGYWVGIQIDPNGGPLRGVTSAHLNGAVLGH